MKKMLFWFFLAGVSGGQIWLLQQPGLVASLAAPFTPVVVEHPALDAALTDYFLDHPQLDRAVQHWYDQLSLQAQVAQLIMPAWDEGTTPEALGQMIEDETVGGFMVLRKDFTPETIEDLKQKNPIKVPLLVSVDAEPSLLKYRFQDDVFTGETADLSTEKDIELVGREVLELLQHYGINLNFAPVYDVGLNQTVIGGRAFSTDSAIVSKRANFLSQLWLEQNLIPTAKHFPGHGRVTGDTHKTLETISGELLELPQFESAIAAQVPVMMVGHLAVEESGYTTEGLPATLSRVILQDLLRDELGFEGVIITDAMNMQAVGQIDGASLKSLQAGTDIVLMPKNPEELNTQILNRVQTDAAFAAQIEAKVKRVLRLKLVWRLGELYKN